jgi:hypothetical protein
MEELQQGLESVTREPRKPENPVTVTRATRNPPDPRRRPGSSKRFSAESVAFFNRFVEENPQGINPIILWIGLVIMELGFDNFGALQ